MARDFISPAWCEFTGRTDGQEHGWGWLHGVHPEDRDGCRAALEQARGQAAPIELRYRLRRHDGHYRWVFDRALAIIPGGVLAGYAGCCTEDATAGKSAEAEHRQLEARLRTIIDALDEGVVALSPDESFGFSNPAFNRIATGHAEPPGDFYTLARAREMFELIDRNNHRLAPRERPFPRLMAGERVPPTEYRVAFEDGRELDIVFRGEPILDDEGRTQLAIAVVRDVTKEKVAADDLQRLQQGLLHTSRVSALGSMAASLAHELNQPLAAISNLAAAAKLVLAERGEAGRGKAVEILDQTVDITQMAGRIVRGLRTMVEKGEPRRSPASMRAIVDNVLLLALASKAGGAVVDLKLDLAADEVIVDQVQIQQVLFNLVRNAVEAMAGSASPHIEIGVAPQDDNWIIVSVADTGPGLAPEVREHLFSPFVTTKESGMGIGLSTCRTIIEGHGGEMWAEDGAAGGAVFKFTLPLAR